MTWTVETLNDAVDRELRALAPDMRARFARICELIAAVGLETHGRVACAAFDRTAVGDASEWA